MLWAAIASKSVTHKTPAISTATKFLQQRQKESIAEFRQEAERHETDKKMYERSLPEWRRSKKSDVPPPWEPDEPVCARYITTDCTIEALAGLLATQPDGLLVCRDELVGWLGGMGEYKSGGKGSDLGHWLAMWSAAPLTVDRKTGTTRSLHIPRAAVSIVGGIQPRVLHAAVGREHMQDGLCARLLAIESAADDAGNTQPYPIDLTPAAKQTWIDCFNRHWAELNRLDDDLAAAWAKLEAYTTCLALIIQLVSWAADRAPGDHVDQASIQSAIELTAWFGIEVERVYGTFMEREDDRDRRELIELIKRSGGRITVRELAHASRKYRAAGTAEEALNELTRYDPPYGSWEVVPTPTNQRREFILHPD